MMNLATFIGLFITIVLAIVIGQILVFEIMNTRWYRMRTLEKAIDTSNEVIGKWKEESTTDEPLEAK